MFDPLFQQAGVRERVGVGPWMLAGCRARVEGWSWSHILTVGMVHSSKLTWKWRRAPYKTSILYIGPSMSFHVNLGKGIRYLKWAVLMMFSRPISLTSYLDAHLT